MSKYIMPPRQKMINLIYIILIAILAIHISKDAIEGYDIISNDYRPQIVQLQTYNEELRVRLEQERPEVRTQVQSVKDKTNAIRQELNDLKESITQKADKDDYQSGTLKNRDDERATPAVLGNGRGAGLKNSIVTFKQEMGGMIADNAQKKLADSYLNITPQANGTTWEEETFSHLTANAGIAILDKMEVELLNYEKEVLLAMTNGEGVQPAPAAPEEKAETVAPQTETSPRQAEASDEQVLVNGVPTGILTDGTLEAPFVQMAPEEVGTLYKGYENKLRLTSIGITPEQLRVSMQNGKVLKRNNRYIAIPDNNSRTAGITVSNGEKVLAQYEYEVKSLPVPQPYIVYSGNGKELLYKGNVPISKKHLLGMSGLAAQANEGPRVSYEVVSFETVFIGAGSDKVITLQNKGNKFSDEQKKVIGQLRAGDKFYITSITVSGGQKTNEQIGSINVILY